MKPFFGGHKTNTRQKICSLQIEKLDIRTDVSIPTHPSSEPIGVQRGTIGLRTREHQKKP